MKILTTPFLFMVLALSSCNDCTRMPNRFNELISTQYNYCETDDDCTAIWGACPMGCFFIINKEKIGDVELMKEKVQKACPNCFYKCPTIPLKFKCINKVCYPGIEEDYVASLFYGKCDKIVEFYHDDLLGRKVADLKIRVLDYNIVPKDSSVYLIKSPDESSNNIKLIVNKEGIIVDVGCFQR